MVGTIWRKPARPLAAGTLRSRTMMVMMTAMTPSEKASSRAGEALALGMIGVKGVAVYGLGMQHTTWEGEMGGFGLEFTHDTNSRAFRSR